MPEGYKNAKTVAKRSKKKAYKKSPSSYESKPSGRRIQLKINEKKDAVRALRGESGALWTTSDGDTSGSDGLTYKRTSAKQKRRKTVERGNTYAEGKIRNRYKTVTKYGGRNPNRTKKAARKTAKK